MDRYALESARGGNPLHVLDFPSHDLLIKEIADLYFPIVFWPEDLYIPGGADYKNYWFWPCPDNQRYGRQWIIGNDRVPGADGPE